MGNADETPEIETITPAIYAELRRIAEAYLRLVKHHLDGGSV